ncbi:RapZ C-terminal domain-containing protein [Streptomyces chrestomyceticus]|uniref:RapZ C-terminal domain-containing protein n=1 Tax=Streptomyces chrestomyceticus TaxID=68185 RepID=UPI003408010E
MAVPLSTVVITSHGALHHDPPPGLRPVLVDAAPLPYPAVGTSRHGHRPSGRDRAVRDYVIRSPAGQRAVRQALERIRQRIGPSGRLDVHVRSPHGHIRAPAVAEELADRLRAAGVTVHVEHRHLGRPDPSADR